MESFKTLRAIEEHPLRKPGKFAFTAKALGKRLLAENKSATTACPNTEAVRFYALNQIMAGLANKYTVNETLPSWGQSAVEMYSKELVSQYTRLFWYTFLISVREWRHLKNAPSAYAKNSVPASVSKVHPLVADSQDESSLNKWLAALPDMPLGTFLNYITLCFKTPGHWGGGYGGELWGNISACVQSLAEGKTSAEVFIDTAYTLAHNNGPIFNKNMQYTSHQHGFLDLLNIQRSGQMCEAINGLEIKHIDMDIAQMVHMATPSLGITDFVDWFKVEEWAAHNAKYPKQKLAQTKKQGKATVTLIDGKPIKIVGEFEWNPGSTVDIYKRVTA